MKLRDLLHTQYAVLKDLREKSVTKHVYTIDRFRDFLQDTFPGRDPEPTLGDLDDLLVMRFLRWRAGVVRYGKKCSPATVSKDKDNLLALATFAAKKRMKPAGRTEAMDF